MANTAYEGWALLELFGHRVRPGYVSEVEMYGGKLLRIDIPLADGCQVSEFYGTGAVYCMTPCTEEVARARIDRFNDPRPIAPVSFRPHDTKRITREVEAGEGEKEGGDGLPF